MSDSPRVPIAVVGVSAIFPGSTDANGFWTDILSGKDLLTEVPPSHWLIEDYYDADPSKPDKTYAKKGGFLPTIDFDALTWGVPPSIIPATDTAQLLALIVAQKVLEDAWGEQFMTMDKSRMSCILGVTSAQELLNNMVSRLQRPVWVKAMRDAGLGEDEVQDIADRIGDHYAPWQEATFPGLLGNVVAGRIANRLDLGGTNCVTDAACASTFSALHMAVNELYLGDSDVVIAGGVDTMNDIFMYMCFSKTPALSPKGDCKPFSDDADGTMLGEGMGMVALKRLADAERDGDKIYAVVQAVGSSSDGRSKSVYAPVSAGQAKAIRRSYERAGFGADTVELVEAHGTGTMAGDAAEFGGLRMVYEETGRTDKQWCALGTVKSQIGHTKAAAGAAGLFKGVMALHHKTLPPTAKIQKPNPKLEIEDSPFYLGTRARPWIRGSSHPRRAGVSSFGFGGSNFHVALEEYTGPSAAGRLRSWSHELVLLSADSALDLSALAGDLSKSATDLRWEAWRSVQAWQGGTHRLAIVAHSIEELKARLAKAASLVSKGTPLSTPDGIHYGHGEAEGQIAFLFPGQGSQYVDMGATVAMNLDAARGAWDMAADLELADTPLHDIVFPKVAYTDAEEQAQAATLTLTQWAQPAIGAASLALLEVAASLGLEADHVAGHSYGEITALHAAGLLTDADMLRVARKRGELMAEAAWTDGTMTAVSAHVERVRELLAEWKLDDPHAGGVVVANHNHPLQVVLSGSTEAITAVEDRLQREGVTARRLNVATAFHSPIVSASTVPFAEFLEGIEIGTGSRTAWSNAAAAPYATEPAAVREALSGQIAESVRFVEMIEAMHEAGVRTFVEVGPGHVLTNLTGRILRKQPHLAVSMDRKGRDGLHQLLEATAELLAHGHALQPTALWDGYKAPVDPASIARPKLAVPINGANVGKPYPPKNGAAGRPQPNPPRQPEVVERIVEVVVERVVEVPVEVPVEMPVAASRPSHTPSPVAPMSTKTTPADGSWLSAYQEVQRQTAAAHTAYQQSMAQSHAAFLKAAETSIMGLATMGGGVAITPVSAQPVVGTPVSAQPVAPAPVPVAAPAPAPVVAAPVAPAPIALSPIALAPIVTAPAPVAAAPTADLTSVMLAVVADKTGYPAEMLSLDMDMEGDLGIDSIKRVEILSTMKERVPGLPEVDPAQLAKLRTLGEIVEHMGGSAVSQEASTASVSPATELTPIMLEIVADKTGYPAEMLSLDMDMEGDLGIDSIKRVEILSAMKERVPGLPEVDPGELAKLRTLGQIVEHMGGSAVSQEASTASSSPSTDLTPVMLAVVAEKTGYPAEMLSLDMDMEGDLGIDSIKRVEILSAMKERVPGLPEVDPAQLAKLRTLGQIVEHMGGAAPVSAAAESATTPAAAAVVEAVAPAGLTLGRFVTLAVPAPAMGMARAGLTAGAEILVTGDDPDLADALADALVERGLHASAAAQVPTAVDDLGGLVVLAGLDDSVSSGDAHGRAFAAAKAVAARFAEDGGMLVTVQDTGGRFGLGGLDIERAWRGGIAGLARTAAQEWPAASVKALDLQRGGRDIETLARVLADEIVAGGPELEVGLTADGQRWTLVDEQIDVQPGAAILGSGDVVVVSGGGRGVTAATVIALAGATKARFVLLGRTKLGDEPSCCAGVEGDADLKRALLVDAQSHGGKVAPAALGKQVRTILANREIRGTVAAIQAAGGQARYDSVDVTDVAGLRTVLTDVVGTWGPVTGLIHGAGVLADKLIADKTMDQLRWVFDTKVDGLKTLLDVVADAPLKAMVMFSSVAARCGNQGQVDYAMANEVLNQVARAEAAARPGCVVKSLGWGPWEGGMVTPALKARFESLGVAVIPLDAGSKMLVDELASPQTGQVALVLGGAPRVGQPLAAEGRKDMVLDLLVKRASHPYLADHSIQGMPVVPVVLAVEWFARAARAFRPDLKLIGVEDIKVLSGVKLAHFEHGGDRLQITVRQLSNGTGAILALEIRGAGGRKHYTATAHLADSMPVGKAAPLLSLDAWGGQPVYGDVLFHGPDFQVITDVEGVSKEGGAAVMHGVNAAGWSGEAWQTDVAAFDGGLQLALLWTQKVLGGHSLPTGVGSLRLASESPSHGQVRCVLKGRRFAGSKTVSDLVFQDADGRTVAELSGVETHLLPQA